MAASRLPFIPRSKLDSAYIIKYKKLLFILMHVIASIYILSTNVSKLVFDLRAYVCPLSFPRILLSLKASLYRDKRVQKFEARNNKKA